MTAEGTNVDERILATLLNELDGVGIRHRDGSNVDTSQQVKLLVLAATSREDDLDTALLRPGRLGAIVRFHLPGKDDRIEVFKACTASMPLDNNVDIAQLASHPSMASATCADIKSVCVEACMLAVRAHVREIETSPLTSVIDACVGMEHFAAAMMQLQSEEKLKTIDITAA